MKSYSKRIRRLRRLAIAGCLASLVVPAGASAMLPNDSGVRHESAQPSQPAYTMPARFRTEIQTPAPRTQASPAFVLRRSSPEARNQAPVQASTPAPSVIRQIETVSGDNSGRTLSIVLAAVALAVALASLGYATIRMTQLQRRELGSH